METDRNKLDRHIPEWLLLEVLIRLPVKLVFRFKLVSKAWLSLISDPSFIRMYIARASQSPQSQPWTFIYFVMHANGHPLNDLKYPLLVDVHSQDLKPPSVYVLPCFPKKQHSDREENTIVGVSNGLVLYIKSYYRNITRYMICNPITGKWIPLPPRAKNFWNFTKGFTTRVENGVLTSYRVVCIDRRFIKMLKFEVFISEIGKWKDFTVCIDQEIEVTFCRRPIDLNGILHWITREHGIIAYDPYHKPDSLRFIPLPGDIDLTCNDKISNGTLSLLDAHQGGLRYFEVSNTSIPDGLVSFCVWILNDYNVGDWRLHHMARYADILSGEIIPDPNWFETLSFHPFDPDIVFLGYGNVIVSYNMKIKKIDTCYNLLGAEVPVAQTIRDDDYRNKPCWWLTFLFMSPSWPTYIPLPSSGVTGD